jgi:hypothetical protein
VMILCHLCNQKTFAKCWLCVQYITGAVSNIEISPASSSRSRSICSYWKGRTLKQLQATLKSMKYFKWRIDPILCNFRRGRD